MSKRQYITESGAIETHAYDESTDTMTVHKSYDVEAVLDANKADRNSKNSFERYKPNAAGLIHVGRVDGDDISRLRMLGYNLLSHDPDEVKRALLYLQSEEKNQLTVDGKPFAKKRPTWQ